MLVRTTSHEMKNQLISQIGNTPILPLEKISIGMPSIFYAKAEMCNPGGSIKDRLAKSLIETAELDGSLVPGGVVIEVTSGNTGISVAWICAARGYKSVIVMSDKNSQEKRDMMKSFGAELVLTPHTAKPDDPCSNYKTAERLAHDIPNSVFLDQYNNPANIDCHYRLTGPEIWNQTGGRIDCLIAGAGTGGTLSGVGRYLKEQNPKIEIVAVDTEGSIFASYFQTGKIEVAEHYEIEGIGGDKLVEAMDFSVVDQFIRISDKEAFVTTRELARIEGIFCGGSSGAAIAAARKVLRNRPDLKTPVIILPDSGNRYLSKIYNDSWMTDMGYLSVNSRIPDGKSA
jgi:cystathionine beta-synthase